MRWSEAGYLSRIVLSHAPRQASVSLILGVRQNMKFQRHAISQFAERVTLSNAGKPISYGGVIDLWRTNAEFRKSFSDSIRCSPFRAFFWETPPLSTSTLGRDFEYTLTQSSELLHAIPDPSPFAKHFETNRDSTVLTFPNLGRDAILVVPCPASEWRDYTHLGQFIQCAPEAQIDLLWKSVGEAMKSRISSNSVWLSTAGLGVSWLHLRLDSRPKYYHYEPYKGA